MNFIIDARSPYSSEKLFSLSLVERIARQLSILQVKTALIVISQESKSKQLISKEFEKRFDLQLQWLCSVDRLSIILRSENMVSSGITILEGDGIYDDRVLKQLLESDSSLQIINEREPNAPLAVTLDEPDVKRFADSGKELKEFLVSSSVIKLSTRLMQAYIRFLRKHIEPVLLRLTDTKEIRTIENDLYEKTFKGGMEIVAIYGYRIPVRELTRFFAKTPVTPNMVTALATICKLGAIPFFFYGYLLTGLILAFSFIILDSLDGKLARMTFRFSETADKVDHMTSMPARVGWNFGMCWYFSGGDMTSFPGIAGLILTILPFMDDINWTIIKHKFHRSLFDLTPFDTSIHLFNVKRNDTALMIIGTIAGFSLQTFYIITLWTIIVWIWHTLRTIYVITVLSKKHPEILQ
jgi:hypothetical protein